MQLETRHFNDQMAYIDNGLLDVAGIGSTYVVRGDEIAIIETGTSRCAPYVLAGLDRLGIAPHEVRHIVLTHVHMDHAGGTGTLLPHMPDAQVYIHSNSIPHLVDPAKLLGSAARALNELFPRHGTMEPIPAARIAPADNLRLDLGRGVVLQAIGTPGHSPDHLAYWDAHSGSLFSGDALGIAVPSGNYAGPVTPPPALSLDDQRATFDHLQALPIETILFSHFGPDAQPPQARIAMLRERWERLVNLVQAEWETGAIDHARIVRAMLGGEPGATERDWALVGWIEMSIRGLVVFFERQAKAARGASGS